MMKKLLSVVILLLLSASVYAAPISRLIFFGDSLSDNGNLYHDSLRLIPKSPPYYLGRFSNGPTWAENVGNYYYAQDFTSYKVYAVAGATAIYHRPRIQFVAPSTLDLQLRSYFLESKKENRAETLYTIWIGANDYMYGTENDVDAFTTQVVDRIEAAIMQLVEKGGSNFLIMNLPDLSKTPMAQNDPLADRYATLTKLHNQKLAAMLERVKSENPELKIAFVNIFDLFNEALDSPEKYNKEFDVNITNTTESCWKGGYLGYGSNDDPQLTADIQKRSNDQVSASQAQAMSDYILSNPMLAQSYEIGKAYEKGQLPCANPEQRLFWDHVHPSAVVHQIIAKIAIKELAKDIIQ